MPVRAELPKHLRTRPFLVAEALAAGVSVDALKNPALRAPFRGVRVPEGVPADLVSDCRALMLLLPPGSAFTGATGAALRGLPLPRRPPHRTGGREVLEVVVPAGGVRHRVRVAGVAVRRAALVTTGPVRGLPVETAPELWAALVPRLALVDAVALADAVLRRSPDPAVLRQALARRPGARHVGRLREVAVLARCGVDSPMETRWRLLVTGVGIPEPELGGDVLDDAGGWIARPDGQWRAARVAVEYEGDHHRTDRRQWQSDVARDQLLQREGYRVVRLTAASVLRDPARTLDHLWCELAERGLPGLPPRPSPPTVRALVARLDALPGRAVALGGARDVTNRGGHR